MSTTTCGNPQLRDWMKEEMERIQQTGASKLYYTYKKAYESLKKCPITFMHPSETVALDGIGNHIAGFLTDKLKRYCQENGLPMPPSPTKAKRKRAALANTNNDDNDGILLDDNGVPIPFRPAAKKRQKPYVPKFRTGGYGILLALLDIHDVGRADATQQQICRLAKDHCDASYTLPEPGKSYTVWNSMKTLVEKGYIYKCGSPRKYQLTETGFALAEKLKQVNATNAQGNAGPSSTSRTTSLPTSSGAAFAAAIGSDSDDENVGIDLSQYVLNPSQYSSISINGRTSSATASSSSNPSTARSRNSRNRFENESDDGLIGIDWNAIDRQDQQQPNQQPSSNSISAASTTSSRTDIMAALSFDTNYRKTTKKTKGKGKTTASIFDSLLESMGGERDLSQPDMSLYVMNPSKYQSISINGISATNAASGSRAPTTVNHVSNIPTNPTLIASSSITSASTSAFARRVMSEVDNNTFDDLERPTKYRTPATSSILLRDANPKKTIPKKRQYNIDEYEADFMDSSSLPVLNSTQLAQPSTDDIIDLLSSPEHSPELRPILGDDEPIFADNFNPDKDYFPLSQSRNRHILEETFHFTYLDTDNKPQRHLAKAKVDIDDINGGLAYLVKYQTKQASHPKARYLIKRSVQGEFITAYLPEIHMETVCPGLPATPILPLHREEEDSFWPETKAISETTHSQLSSSIASPNLSQTTNFSQTSSQNDLVSQPFFPSQQSQKKPDFDMLVAKEPITDTLLPGQYEIILVLDSREIQMRGNRKYFQERLSAKGIQCVTRSMDLGDVIWIARPTGSTDQSEELFLDFILERKRLDDLVSSIKDGRFIEQKTRLKRTGAKRVMYVVENYNREEAERFGMQAVQTAMSSTQIIDGIFLKRTNAIEDTIDYLVSVTKLIKQMYQGYTLHAIPGHLVARQTYLDLKQAYLRRATDKEAYLVSYPLFGQLNSKNGSTSVHQVYLRMLMTIRGVNAEKALSLIKVYPTPKSLLMAFQRSRSPEEAKNLAKHATREHITRRRWSAKNSENLYDIWGSLEYPTGSGSEDEERDL